MISCLHISLFFFEEIYVSIVSLLGKRDGMPDEIWKK